MKVRSYMSEDLISIVIPVFNVEKYLDKCIDTVCNQSYQNIQIILVDDGSTDNCGSICDKAARKDKRITVLHKTNGGLSDARNCGIDIANGKYITFIDSDDYISKDYVDYLYNLIKKYDAKISICGHVKTKSETENARQSNPTEECFGKEKALEEMLYARKFSTSAWGKLYLTELFEDVRYPLGKFSEDMFTTYKVIAKADRIVYGSQICYYYLRRNGSILVSQFSEKHMDVLDGLNQLKKDIPLEQYGLEKAYSSQMVECIAAMLERKPESQVLRKLGIWNLLKRNRKNVLTDSKTSKRVKGYAMLSYFGLYFSITVINAYYNRKWKEKND